MMMMMIAPRYGPDRMAQVTHGDAGTRDSTDRRKAKKPQGRAEAEKVREGT